MPTVTLSLSLSLPNPAHVRKNLRHARKATESLRVANEKIFGKLITFFRIKTNAS